jgi:hypothetical protein
MVAYCRPDPAALAIVFERDGEEPIRVEAADGERAVLTAVKLLLKRGQLRPGDRLIVEVAD